MPEITVIHIALLAVALVAGMVIGWVFRSRQSSSEKAAINAGWQEQLEAQRAEHERLVDQNRMLMEQNSQYQASNKDSKMRATELSSALKEAFERRDELQRQIKDIRGNLESAVQERDQLQSDMAHQAAEVDVTSIALKQRDDRIAQLKKELAGWQERVPPLVERFRTRNEEAQQLEEELAAAQDRIAALETMVGSEQTRVEPVDRSALGDDLHASNESLEAAADDATEQDNSDPESVADTESGDTDASFDALSDEDEPELVDSAEIAESESDDDADATDDGTDETAEAAATVDGEVSLDEEAVSDSRDDDETDAGEQAASEDFDVSDQADNDAWDDDEDDGSESVRSASIYPFAASANGRDRDNLKRIKGVGPAIEKTLNEMGIWRFHQIAEMSEYDIDRIARRLKGFRSRIYREDWIGQARDLEQRKTADQH